MDTTQRCLMEFFFCGCGETSQAYHAVKDTLTVSPSPEGAVLGSNELARNAPVPRALPTLLARDRSPQFGEHEHVQQSKATVVLPTKSSSAPCNTSAPSATSAPRREESGAVTKSRSVRSAAAVLKPEVRCPLKMCEDQFNLEYEKTCPCGNGSFSTVWLVRHTISKQPRACKVLAKPVKEGDVSEKEAEVLKNLNHPHILKLYEVYLVNKRVHLIVDFCDGGDLAGRIRWHAAHEPMDEELIAYMMRQILSGTAYCHGKDVIHRDLKPGNILFVDDTAESPIKLSDFGLADFHEHLKTTAEKVEVPRKGVKGWVASMTWGGKALISPTKSKLCMSCAGTPNYMAPEVVKALQKGGYYDHKADIYSIGVILYYLLESCFPFEEQTAHSGPYNRLMVPTAVPSGACASSEPRFTRSSWTASWLCKALLRKSSKQRPSAEQAMSYLWLQDPAKRTPYGHGHNGTHSTALTNSTFEELRKYPAYNKLKRAALQLLEQELTEREIQALRAKFMALNQQGDGRLSAIELAEGMRHIGYAMDRDEVERIVEALDTSGTRRIGYREFISALIDRRNFDERHLWECFKKFDVEGSGRISYADISRVLLANSGGSCGVTESEWREIAQGDEEEDVSPDNFEMTFNQFLDLMRQG